jgi:hypothetical protein
VLSRRRVTRGSIGPRMRERGEGRVILLSKENISPLTDIFGLDTVLAISYISAGSLSGFLFRLWSVSGSIPVCLLKAKSLA